MDKWVLPTGWAWLPISAMIEDTDRRNPTQSPDEFFYYVDIGSVNNERGAIDDSLVKQIKGKDAPSRARKVIREGNVIFATTRPYLKNIALVPEKYDGQVCSTGFCVLSTKKEIGLSKYLYYAVRSSFFIEQLIPQQRGANYPAVTDTDVFQAEIPLPYPNDWARSLAEQQRIVARLESLLGEVREMRTLQDAIQVDVTKLMDAVLKEVFKEGERQNWTQTNVGHLMLGKPQYGTSKKSNPDKVGLPVLRMGNIQDGQINLSDLKYVNLSQTDRAKYLLVKGDVLFNRTNSAELVGKTAVFDLDDPMVFASYLIRFKVDSEQTNPHFVSYYINSVFGRRYVTSHLVRAIGQVNVNAQKLRAMPILLPKALVEQNRIVKYIDNLKAEIASMQLSAQEDAQGLDVLEQSILAQAFQGEL